MTKPLVADTESFDQWRVKQNQVSENVGDPQSLNTVAKNNLVDAINELKAAFDAYVALHP